MTSRASRVFPNHWAPLCKASFSPPPQHMSKVNRRQALSLVIHSAALARPARSTRPASQWQPALYNPYGLHSICQSWISSLNLPWIQALTQKSYVSDSEMRRSPFKFLLARSPKYNQQTLWETTQCIGALI